MFRMLIDKILAIFGKKKNIEDAKLQENEEYEQNYINIKDINFAAIFANKFANYTMSDSSIDIVGDNKRAKILGKVIKQLKRKMKKVITRMIGIGGVLVIPYVKNSKLYFNIVSQSRLIINQKIGEDIIDCTVMAEHIVRDQKNYYRWHDYTLQNGNLYIRYRATMENSPIDLASISEWANIKDVAISNVEHMPFMFIKSPIDNRRDDDSYGVPITYGCDKQIFKIKKTLEQIEREYDLKEVFVGADVNMFNGPNGLPKNGIYKKIDAGEDSFWEVFDPAYRDEPLFRKLKEQFALLEKMIGTSKGILTDLETSNATATEIKKMLKDSFDIVDDIRDNLEEGLEQFLYACDVLANYYGLSPQGEYELSTDWSYDLLEDPQQTYNQMLQGESRGVIKKFELRQFLRPDESLEESEQAILEIKEESPTTKDLLGE